MATLALRALTKSFGEVRAVRALDLEVADAELFVLVGPSGSGKSTVRWAVANGTSRPRAGGRTGARGCVSTRRTSTPPIRNRSRIAARVCGIANSAPATARRTNARIFTVWASCFMKCSPAKHPLRLKTPAS